MEVRSEGEILWSLQYSIVSRWLRPFPRQWLVAGPGIHIVVCVCVCVHIYIYVCVCVCVCVCIHTHTLTCFSNGVRSVLSYSQIYFVCQLDTNWDTEPVSGIIIIVVIQHIRAVTSTSPLSPQQMYAGLYEGCAILWGLPCYVIIT